MYAKMLTFSQNTQTRLISRKRWGPCRWVEPRTKSEQDVRTLRAASEVLPYYLRPWLNINYPWTGQCGLDEALQGSIQHHH